MARVESEISGVELAKRKIAKRRKDVERTPFSYLWIIPLGHLNSSSNKWYEVKGDREAIVIIQRALSQARREDWTDVKLDPEKG